MYALPPLPQSMKGPGTTTNHATIQLPAKGYKAIIAGGSSFTFPGFFLKIITVRSLLIFWIY
jgi:hypothetical protein